MKNRFSLNQDMFIVVILYSLSNFLMLLNNGIYWDDWVLYNVDPGITIDRFIQAGGPLTGSIHVFLLSFDSGIFLYRGLTFVFFLIAALFLIGILRNITEVGDTSRLIIVLIFALLPFNTAKITLICFPYALCNMLFFFGFWVLTRFLVNKNNILRLVTLVLFFFSFFTHSFLAFYFIIFLYIAYIEKEIPHDIKSIFTFGRKYLDFILLPFIFFGLKNIFFRPYGLYTDYNKFSLGIINPCIWIKSFFMTFYNGIIEIIPSTGFQIALFSLLFILLVYYFYKNKYDFENFNEYNLIFFICGCLIYLLAIFPYIMVGKVPGVIESWNSRDLLLVPLGSAFLLYFGTQGAFNYVKARNIVRIMFYSLLIALFIVSGIALNINFQKDNYKQQSIIENMKINSAIQEYTTFIFIDNSLEYNAFGDYPRRFYEYTGMMKVAFNNENRFGSDIKGFSGDVDNYRIYLNSYYNMGNYTIAEPQYYIYIEKGEYPLDSELNVLLLKYNEYLSKNDFNVSVKNIVRLDSKKIVDNSTII